MKPFVTCALLLGGLLASAAPAQTVDINDYFVLGRWSKWRFQQVDDPDDVRNVAVTNFKVVKNTVRYTVKLPDVGSLAFLYVTFSRDEAGQLVMHSMRIEDEQLSDFGSAAPVVFPEPIVLGNAATLLDAPPVVHDVHTSFDVKLKVAGLSETVTVMVDGTITTSLESGDDDVATLLDPPDDLIPDAQVILLRLVNFLTFTIDESGIDEQALLDDVIVLHMAEDRGVVFLEEEPTGNFSARRLARAILPGKTLGEFPPNDDITGFSIPVPDGVFTLDGKSDAAATGGAATDKDGNPSGTLLLTDVELEHRPDGVLTLSGMLGFQSPDTGVGEQIPVTLKGKCKFSTKKGVARLKLAGVANKGQDKLSNLAKPLVLKAVADLTAADTSFELSFKSGKDALGTLQLGIVPGSSANAVVTLDGLVDTKFEPPKARPLGSEGFLSFGGVDYPITLTETKVTPKVKEGDDPKPDKRKYLLRATGLGVTLAAIKASSTASAITIEMFKGKLFGTPFQLAEPDDDLDYDDSFVD